MEQLIEEENESSSDESNDINISNLLESKNIDRSTERNYKSYFRLSPKNTIDKEDEEKINDSEETKIEPNRKKQKRRIRPRKNIDVEQQKNSKYFDEEMLVIYYVINLIMINKHQDAMKALSEYTQKSGLSGKILQKYMVVILNIPIFNKVNQNAFIP